MDNNKTENTLDIAIVGGGVGGLYAAWRLASEPGANPGKLAVFESSDRIGGRLWSIGLRSEKAIPAELGGMFFSDSQTLVYDLITKKLALEISKVLPKPDFAYLRTERFRISDFDKPDILPYKLAPDERGKPYHQLLFLALERIVPDLEQYWPLNDQGSFPDLIRHLRTVEFEGKPLRHWGFWNLLAKVLSNEAYLCLRDVVGSFALFSNWNAYDAALSLLADLKGNWHKLPRGYEELPARLGDEISEIGVPIHRNSLLIDIREGEDGGFRLSFDGNGSVRKVSANHVILALPRLALEDLLVRSVLPGSGNIRKSLDALESVPACKIFLTFDEPWWRDVPDGPGRIDETTFAASHTDLPMRQCYYLGTDPHSGDGLLLASYSDAQSVPFWSALMSDNGRRSGLLSDVPESAREEIRRQLTEMHGVDVPAPKDGVFVNWSQPPFGGGWHSWLPGWDSRQVMKDLRAPVRDRHLHVCGEAASAYQGWVEGALTSTEVLLREQFSLSKPDWLSSEACLSPYFP